MWRFFAQFGNRTNPQTPMWQATGKRYPGRSSITISTIFFTSNSNLYPVETRVWWTKNQQLQFFTDYRQWLPLLLFPTSSSPLVKPWYGIYAWILLFCICFVHFVWNLISRFCPRKPFTGSLRWKIFPPKCWTRDLPQMRHSCGALEGMRWVFPSKHRQNAMREWSVLIYSRFLSSS